MIDNASLLELIENPRELPLLTLDEFFSDNQEEDSLAPNQWGYGRPTLAEIHQRLILIEQRDDVAWVRVQLHEDTVWESADGTLSCPDGAVGEAIAICAHRSTSTMTLAEAADTDWMASDGVIEGLANQATRIPEIPTGFRVTSLVWD